LSICTTGDPLDPATQVGPLARPDLVADLHDQVTRSLAAGARLLAGGVRPAGPGAFYPPTVLADVEPGMAAFDEETFGPLAPVMPVRDLEYFWPATDRRHQVFFNRGANGIDGTLSTALGVAHGGRPAVLLTGDLALLHDTNGFLLANAADR